MHIKVSEFHGSDIITAGMYMNQGRLDPDNYLPSYGALGHKSIVAKIIEEGSQTMFQKNTKPKTDIKLSPNPTTDIIGFNLSEPLKARVMISDIYGKIKYDSYLWLT